MQVYIAEFEILDGEHEHRGFLLLKAESDEQAWKRAAAQEHDPDFPKDAAQLTYWDYGDGTTAAKLQRVQKITKAEADSIERLGLASYL